MTDQPIIPVDNGGRDTLGRFASGPGNTGRPRNSRNAVSRATIKAVTDLFSEAVMVLRTKLAEGDLNAAKIVLAIVLPKDRPIEFGEDISPATIEAGHWRRFAQVLGAEFALLGPVASRLGYPEA